MKALRNPLVIAALVLVSFMTQFCKNVADDVNKVKDDAPGICKTICENSNMCNPMPYTGPYAQDKVDDNVKQCIYDCAYNIVTGGYVVKPDDKPQIIATIDGGDIESYGNCLMDNNLLMCQGDSDNKSYSINEDTGTNEGLCMILQQCWMELNLQMYGTLSWDSDAKYCKMETDYSFEGIWGF